MKKPSKALAAALTACRTSISVIPLNPCSKTPALKGWPEKAFRDVRVLKAYGKAHPDANYGFLGGGDLGLVYIDIDKDEGKKALAKLEKKYGKLPATVTVKTPGNGRHYYFVAPGAPISNSVGKLGKAIDVRAFGGFVVGPGSIHPNGGRYAYADGQALGEISIAVLPRWIRKRLSKPKAELAHVVPLTGKDGERAKLYALRALELECARVTKAPLHQRNDTLNKGSFRIGQLVAHGIIDRRRAEKELKEAAIKCGLEGEEVAKTMSSGLGDGMRSPRKLPFGPAGKAAESGPSKSKGLTASLSELGETDAANATRFVRRYGRKVLWTPGEGWHVYDGKCWRPDAKFLRNRYAIKTARAIKQEAACLPGTTDQRRRATFAEQSESKGAIDRMLALAQHELAVDDDKLDAEPFLLNVRNGTIDLKSGRLLPHDSADLITRFIPIRYDPKAKGKLFKAFLRKVSGGNKDLRRFLKKAAGYTLTGSIKEQVLFFLLGPTKTGKSTLVNLLRDLLGGYAIQTPMKTFLVKRFDNEIPVDEARMKGTRMVVAIETNVNQQLDEAKVKAMTGGDKIVGRFMRQNPFEFQPECKIWIAANDPPRIRASDDAIWNRFVVLPFNVQVANDEEQDKDLPDKLRGEFPAVLAWAVRGAKLWAREGLSDKSLFESSKEAWRKSSDTVTRFFNACCQAAGPVDKVQAHVLYSRYKQWCDTAGEASVSNKAFKAGLVQLDIAPKKDRTAHWWIGIKLIN